MSECSHYWEPSEDGDGFECIHCPETCPACIQCHRWTASSLLICERCVRWVRQLLDDIETAVGHYSPAPPSPIPPIRYVKDQISGSRSNEHNPGRWTFHDLHEALTGWADMWAENGAGERKVGAIEYLRGRILWAAHNPEESDWEQWLAEMRTALHTAKREAGILPESLAAPCVHCAGTAVQTRANRRLEPHTDGLSDEVACTGCGLTWETPAHYGFGSREFLRDLPEQRPDLLITAADFAIVWPDIPTGTWRVWAHRGEMPEAASWDERGRPCYLVGDLVPLTERRVDETRRGRRVG